MSADWTTKAKWMREVRAVDASWHGDGTLASLVLGPEPGTDDPAKQQVDPVQQAQQEREMRAKTLSRLSGGPVRRPGECD